MKPGSAFIKLIFNKDGIQSEIADVKIRQSEIPILEGAAQRRIAQAITKLRNAQRMTRKLEHCYKLQLQMIETTAPEPPAGMIRDLHVYAVEIPDGQKFFNEFIAKLTLKYPQQPGK